MSVYLRLPSLSSWKRKPPLRSTDFPGLLLDFLSQNPFQDRHVFALIASSKAPPAAGCRRWSRSPVSTQAPRWAVGTSSRLRVGQLMSQHHPAPYSSPLPPALLIKVKSNRCNLIKKKIGKAANR